MAVSSAVHSSAFRHGQPTPPGGAAGQSRSAGCAQAAGQQPSSALQVLTASHWARQSSSLTKLQALGQQPSAALEQALMGSSTQRRSQALSSPTSDLCTQASSLEQTSGHSPSPLEIMGSQLSPGSRRPLPQVSGAGPSPLQATAAARAARARQRALGRPEMLALFGAPSYPPGPQPSTPSVRQVFEVSVVLGSGEVPSTLSPSWVDTPIQYFSFLQWCRRWLRHMRS